MGRHVIELFNISGLSLVLVCVSGVIGKRCVYSIFISECWKFEEGHGHGHGHCHNLIVDT